MIIVLIAAYDEAPQLVRLLPRVPSSLFGHEVVTVVADDGSGDDTVAVARRAGCATVSAPVNRGKGATLRMGIAAVGEFPYDVLVLMDGDGQHDAADLGALVRPVLSGEADMVIGSRYADGCGREQAPWNRYAVRCATTSLLEAVLQRRFTDPYCGYRALTSESVGLIRLEGDRYQSELEMLFSAAEHGLRVAEVPIAKVYGPGTSKMGSRYGAVLGRFAVIGQYAGVVIRRMIRLRRSGATRHSSRLAA